MAIIFVICICGSITCTGLISCVVFIAGSVIFGCPCVYLFLKFGIRRQRKKDKDELLKGLLEQGQNSQELKNDENDQFFEKIDLSFFNLDFNDFKIEKDIGLLWDFFFRFWF